MQRIRESTTEPLSGERLKNAVRRGTRRTAVAQVSSHVVSLAVLATLLRLVGPSDYGLVAMVLPVLLFLRIFTSLGLNVATIQQPQLSLGCVTTLFWIHLALAVVTCLLTIAVAPAVAWFYGRNELVGLTVGLSGTSIAVALGLQHLALLERELHLGRVAWARVTGQAIGGISAVAAALAGAGVWSLIVQQYVEFIALAAIAWGLEPWRPVAPWKGEPARAMVRFGGHIALSSLLSYFLTNVDKVLVGFTLGPVALGFYSQAFNLMMKPVYVLTAPLASIMLPSLSRSAVDAASFCSMVLAFLRLVAVATFPTAIGLMVTADEAMTVVGGPEWSPAGGLLAALSATIVAQCFVGVAGTIYMARGLARALMAAAVAMTLVLTAGVVVGYGLGRMYDEPALGVAIGYSLTMFAVVFVPYVIACLRLVDVPVGAWLRQMRDPALASLAMGAIVWTCRLGLQRIVGLPPLGLLAIEMAIGVGTYVVLARREIAWCLDQLRRL